MSITIPRTLGIALAGTLLCSFGLQVSAAPPKGAVQQQQVPAVDRRALQRQRVSKPAIPLEEQVAQLRAMVTGLQQEVARLRNDQQENTHDVENQLDQRLDALESVVQISPGAVKLVSGGKLELRSSAHLDLIASGRIKLTGADAQVHAPTFTASGVLRSDTAIHDSVNAKMYTPGVGNIW